MGSAPTPPAQTPVSFLRGGAEDMFTAECKAALLKAGYDPAWFGSYSYVGKQIKDARKKAKLYDDAVKKGKKGLPPKPSPQERYLAGKPPDYERNGCQSGHLTQNAVFQKPKGRGDPCDNLDSAPGHSTDDYPCMPQKGHAGQPGGEHQRATQHERDSAGAQGEPGDPYEGKQVSKDSKERVKSIADDQELAKKNGRKPIEPKGGAEGASTGGGAKSGKSASAASGAAGKSASKPNEPWNKPLKGKTAGECIDSFRNAGEAAMRAKCRDEVEKNTAIANGPKAKNEKEGQAYRDKLKAKAEKARREADKNKRSKRKQKAAADAQRKSSQAENAHCRAQQGRRLRREGIDGPFDGKVPTNATRNDSTDLDTELD
jgi:hypothetical protein